MAYLDYFKLVLKDINRRKFSSFLTFFAIGLGILSIFVIVLLGSSFQASIEEQFNAMGSNRLYISAKTTTLASTTITSGLSDNEVNLIKNRPYISDAYPYYIRSVELKYGNDFKSAMVVGVVLTEDYFKDLNLFNVQEGRIPKSNERYSVVLGSDAASLMFDRKIPVGGNIYIKDTKFKIVGILESVGNPQDDKSIYVDIDTIRNLFDDGNSVGFIDAIVIKGYDVDFARDNLEIMLENRLGKDSVNIDTAAQLLDQLNSVLDIVKLTLGGIAFVSLLVGAFGIINTMYVIVTEKTKDIGIMKAVGARNSDIFMMYVFHAGFFGFLGALFGIVFGSVVVKIFEVWAGSAGYSFLQVKIDFVVVILLLLFGFAIGAISGYLPAKRASKLQIVEAFRR